MENHFTWENHFNTANHFPDLRQGILLSVQMICDEIDDLFWNYEVNVSNDAPLLTGCRLYYPSCKESSTIIYVVPADQIDRFPVDRCPYITSASVCGAAPHIRSVDRSDGEIMDLILTVFQRYKEFESAINSIITGNGSLNDLCNIGCDFFRNPLYIHDNMFQIMAMPRRVQGMLTLDTDEKTGESHIPLWLINDFKFDEAYQATLTKRKASIWGNDQYPRQIRSLYVNLWEGNYYYGRLLINEINSSLKPGQFYLAELFAEYCKLVIRRDIQSARSDYTRHEEVLHGLLNGEDIHDSDLKTMLASFGWQKDNRFLCLKLTSQDEKISVRSDSALRSQLSVIFRESVMFFHEQRLCVLLNLSHLNSTYADIIRELAPLIRDNYVYGGISNPVLFGPDIHYGFLQADVALSYIRKKNTTKWLVNFSECALEYTLEHIQAEIPVRMQIPPVLYRLRSIDQEKGTQYYETLQTYLICERDIPRTSAALFVHRTTLLYRLKKLNELIRMNLDSPDVRLQLLLSFRFMESSAQPDFS